MRINKILAAFSPLPALVTASHADAATLRFAPNLVSVTVYEETFTTTANTFAANSAALLTQRSGALSDTNTDINYFTGENYDVFYSNADGGHNKNGGYLTIEGAWQYPSLTIYGGMNINEVALNFGGPSPHSQFGDFVSSFTVGSTCVVGFGVNCITGSEALAVDHNLSTFPRFGQTSTSNLAERFRLTIGFDGISNALSGVPEPASWALMLAGFGLAGAAMRRRGPVLVAFA